MFCTKELKNMNIRQIELKIREWEDLYAEAFSDGADPSALHLIREKIRELREEILIRSSISS
jgi:hypothetical protein